MYAYTGYFLTHVKNEKEGKVLRNKQFRYNHVEPKTKNVDQKQKIRRNGCNCHKNYRKCYKCVTTNR